MQNWKTNLKKLIKSKGYTHSSFVNEHRESIGFQTQGGLGHYLSGRRGMEVETLMLICEALKVDVTEVFNANPKNELKKIRSSIMLTIGTLKEVNTLNSLSAEEITDYILASIIKNENESEIAALERAKNI